MVAAVIPNKREGEYDGKFRRDVEGTEAGARSVESSYSSNWQLSWTDSRRYPNETEEGKTDALGSGAQEDFARAEGTVGKSESETIEEGRVGVVQPSKKKESGICSSSLFILGT